jgi:hypothetical protein
MDNIISYILESGISLFVFYLLYQAFLKRETFYMLNRAFLLFAICFSVIVPLLRITISSHSGSIPVPFVMDAITVQATGTAAVRPGGPGLIQICTGIYLFAAAILLFRLIINILRIHRLYRVGYKEFKGDYNLVIHPENYPPFSFFRSIFISGEHCKGEPIKDIIEHERTHVQQMHSLDILLTEMIIVLQWFNPFSWIYKKLISENHEFLADAAVINRGFDPESYQLRIISQLFGIRSMPAAHNFNQSITKKRLKMITKNKSSSLARLKFLTVIPAALVMFYLFACSAGDADLSAQDPLKTEDESLVYLEVDVPAEYQGGVDALRKYIAQNITYPKEARDKGLEGRVFVQFVIDENGELVPVVEDSRIPPPPPPPVQAKTAEIDGIVVVGYRPPEGEEQDYNAEDLQVLFDEAVRVIKGIPGTWTPALKEGKAVKSAWTIPISFTLE